MDLQFVHIAALVSIQVSGSKLRVLFVCPLRIPVEWVLPAVLFAPAEHLIRLLEPLLVNLVLLDHMHRSLLQRVSCVLQERTQETDRITAVIVLRMV